MPSPRVSVLTTLRGTSFVVSTLLNKVGKNIIDLDGSPSSNLSISVIRVNTQPLSFPYNASFRLAEQSVHRLHRLHRSRRRRVIESTELTRNEIEHRVWLWRRHRFRLRTFKHHFNLPIICSVVSLPCCNRLPLEVCAVW